MTPGASRLTLALLFALSASGSQWPTRDSVPLNQFPFIMTHDAATGYLGSDPVDWWAKTQTVRYLTRRLVQP